MKKQSILLMIFTYAVLFLCFNAVSYAAENDYNCMTPKSDVATDKSWYVKFTEELNKDTVNNDNIYIVDENDNKVKCYLELQSDNKTVKVVSLVYYKYDTTYNLIVSSNVKEASGKNLSHPVKMSFTTRTEPPSDSGKSDSSKTEDDKLIVCIDPGHRGNDSQNIVGSDGTRESDVDLFTALKLGDLLKKAGADVVYTRTNDENVDSTKRFEISNAAQADYFVSIHCNKYDKSDSNGFEVYYTQGDTKGMALAEAIQENVTKATGLTNRGVKASSTVAELNGANASGVKVCLGFLSNPSEEKKLADESFQQECADAMAKAIEECGNGESLLNVKSIKSVILNIKEGQTYSLPDTVEVTLGDGTVQSLPVAWNNSGIDSNKAGTYTAKGTIEHYTKPVFATVIVLDKNSDGRPVVCVDVGYCGYDPGTIGISGTKEKDITLPVALKVGKILKDKNINVVYTRTSNDVSWPSVEVQDLQKRCDISNSVKANYFVCIHCNSGTSSASGTETYYLRGSSAGQILAGSIQSKIVKATGSKDRGIKTAGYYVLDNTDCPAILTELGFLSNASEEALLNSDSYQNKCAEAIAEAVLECLGKTQ